MILKWLMIQINNQNTNNKVEVNLNSSNSSSKSYPFWINDSSVYSELKNIQTMDVDYTEEELLKLFEHYDPLEVSPSADYIICEFCNRNGARKVILIDLILIYISITSCYP